MIEDDADGAYQKKFFVKQLAQILRGKRFENGAISFTSQEVRF